MNKSALRIVIVFSCVLISALCLPTTEKFRESVKSIEDSSSENPPVILTPAPQESKDINNNNESKDINQSNHLAKNEVLIEMIIAKNEPEGK